MPSVSKANYHSKDYFVAHVKSNDRRRRLRLIKAVEERSALRLRSAASALSIAADTEATRLDIEALRTRLFQECRADASTHLRVEHPGLAPIEVRMDRPYLVIGSDPTCSLHLNHEEIKPRHLLLQWIDGHLFSCDIAPRTSLFPGRDALSNGQWVDENPISIGPYRLSLAEESNISAPDFSPLDRSSRLATEYPLLALQFEGVEQSNNVWPINRMLTLVGRSSQCRLRLNHKSISQVQACLLRTSSGCWLIDLANNGTTGSNGRSIQIVPVDIGDVLQFGNFRVEVVTMALPSPVSATETSTEKPLPPIKLDRPPKANPRQPAPSVDYENESPNDDHLNEPAIAIDQGPLAKLPPIKFDRPPRNDFQQPTVPFSQPPVALPQSAVAKNKPVAEVGTSQDNSLPPIKFDRPPRNNRRQQPVYVENPTTEHQSGESEILIDTVPSDSLPPIRFDRPPQSHLRKPVADNTQNVEPASIQPTSPPKSLPTVQTTDLRSTDEIVAQFIKQQQSELAQLKNRLDALKYTFDTAMGQLISKKMCEMLEKPVIETLKSHDSMYEALTKFTQTIAQESV